MEWRFKNMTSIKIFVSHRKDTISKTIKNPLYINVVCGQALADSQKGKLGDNTGNNISEKAPNYSEFTVQYWAWKNQKADYYGLCHYRRYLSFADKFYPEWNEQRFAAEKEITNKNIRKYGLLDYKKMKQEIKKYDLITSVTYAVEKIPNIPKFKNVYEAFVNSPAIFTTPESINKLKKIILNKFPQYYDTFIEELESSQHRGFNCFIMKKELFFLMSEFQFGCLFELEKLLNLENRVGNYVRELGYLGEILYGTFIRWIIKQNCYKVKETQIVLFLNTEKVEKNKRPLLDKLKKALFPGYKKVEKKLSAIHGGLAWQLIEMDKKISLLSSQIMNLQKQNNLLFFSQHHEFPKDLKETKLVFMKSFPKAIGDLRIIQLANFILLKNFKLICDKLNIKFWLHGGSLVGGLRHNGFVPWDDDIDIAMMRDDFGLVKSFLEKNSNIYEIKEYYYIQIGCRSYRFRRKDIESECFVDIFVYDNYKIKYNELTDWQNLCNQKQRIKSQSVAICKELAAYPTEPTLQGFEKLKSKLDILFNNYIEKNKSTSKEDFLIWGIDNNYENETKYAWNHGRIFNTKDIFPLKTCKFEDINCYIPADFEKYTFAEYGIPYWEMPNNLGESIHWKQYFSKPEQIELAKQIIKDDIIYK